MSLRCQRCLAEEAHAGVRSRGTRAAERRFLTAIGARNSKLSGLNGGVRGLELNAAVSQSSHGFKKRGKDFQDVVLSR